MDRRIRRLTIALAALFVLLFAQISYVQVFHSDAIAGNPANAYRQVLAEYKVFRGPILANDARTQLAVSRKTKGQLVYQRRYPDGPLFAGATGFYSLVYGRTELEQAMNPFLNGDAPELAAQTFADLVLGRPKQGATVITTIDAKLQAVATRALGSQSGAVVAIDPATGAVLAIVSNPSFDPNLLSSGTRAQITAQWDKLNRDPAHPLLSNANDQLYPPGSTFKIITASAALENGITPQTSYPNPVELDLPLTNGTLKNFGGEHCAGGAARVTLALAFQISCNVTFGQVGLQLGAAKLQAQAQAYGFCPTDPPKQTDCIEPTIPFTIPFQSGRFPEPSYFDQNDPLVAISAIGQDNVLANPMQMALVAATVANGGTMMQPQLVQEIRDPQGRVVKTFDPVEYGRPISSATARALTQMMVSVTQPGGTAYGNVNVPGVTVAGKTGTAQHGTNVNPHAWFTAFAPADNPKIAVAVVVLDGGSFGSEATGGHVAAPIASQVINA
ncbi:MAG: penicillin-binding protein, partial [Solirubrobacterales bacterium]|nr:penicillin-binding protein [Solirubrobacterales bacterium]